MDTIFYPCMSYNFDEGISDNNYNCPVVAYYPELIAANLPQLKDARFLHPYFGLHRPQRFQEAGRDLLYGGIQHPQARDCRRRQGRLRCL